MTRLEQPGVAGLLGLLTVWCGLALGHSTVVLQWELTGGVSVQDSLVSLFLASVGFVLLWIGLKRPENQATFLGYLAGSFIWVGLFEWTWHYFGHWLQLQPIVDNDIPILMPGLQMIQSTSLIVIALLIFLGANKDTRCRMFMWFHRNLRLRPGRMTAGYKRQHARTTAMETVFLIWFIYICAITINDPRLIRYDSTAAMVITVAFVVWGIYLVNKLLKVRGLGAAFRYSIPTAHILWLPIEAFSRWGLYPEVWVKPTEFPVIMTLILILFITAGSLMIRSQGQTRANPPTTPVSA